MEPNEDSASIRAEFKAIVAEASKGDPDALDQLRRTLDANSSLWKRVGRMATDSELALVDEIAGGDALIRESVLRTLAKMREDLGGASPTALESLAIARIVTTWLAVQAADKLMAAGSSTLPNAHFLLKRQESAHRQHSAALKSLNDARRLLPAAKRKSAASETDGPPNLSIFSESAAATIREKRAANSG